MSRVLAFDFGASSGRAILGAYEKGALSYQEVHRFENNPREKEGHLRWDFEDLLANVRLGAQKAGPVDSLAFDTWGVDFGLLDAEGRLLGDPVHYRDQRTAGLVEQAFRSLPAGELYRATGTQILPINSLYQLLALQQQGPRCGKRPAACCLCPICLPGPCAAPRPARPPLPPPASCWIPVPTAGAGRCSLPFTSPRNCLRPW